MNPIEHNAIALFYTIRGQEMTIDLVQSGIVLLQNTSLCILRQKPATMVVTRALCVGELIHRQYRPGPRHHREAHLPPFLYLSCGL